MHEEDQKTMPGEKGKADARELARKVQKMGGSGVGVSGRGKKRVFRLSKSGAPAVREVNRGEEGGQHGGNFTNFCQLETRAPERWLPLMGP